MPTCDPWAEVRAKTAELAARILFWERRASSTPMTSRRRWCFACGATPRQKGRPPGSCPGGGGAWPASPATWLASCREIEREAALGVTCTRSLEPGLPVEGGDPIPGEPVAPDPGANPGLVAARLAALTRAQARVFPLLLEGEELTDMAATSGMTCDAVRHLIERARERVAGVEEVRAPPPGDFPGPFTGRQSAWSRPHYLQVRGWTPSDLAKDAGISRAAMEERLRRIERALERRAREACDRSRGESRPPSSWSCGGARGSVL